MEAVYSIRTPILTLVMKVVSFIGYEGVISATVLLVLFFLLQRQFQSAYKLAVVSLGAHIFNHYLKIIFHMPRPDTSPLQSLDSYGFPSGHSMGSVAFYFYCSYLLTNMYPKYKLWLYTATTILVLLVGFSRVYLGVHYVTDVVGGYTFGAIWLIACLFLFQKPHNGKNKKIQQNN